MNRSSASSLRFGALAAVALAWAASLALPAIEVRGGPTLDGLDVLVRGWQALPRGMPAWLANPLFAAALAAAALRRARVAAGASAAALLFALSTFATDVLLRGGQQAPDFMLRAGFYLWLAAVAVLCVCAWLDALGCTRPEARRRISTTSRMSRD
ncbi:MAG TPA: hypothetical protein VF329_08070 [Gammaproteobacteria bacterium]